MGLDCQSVVAPGQRTHTSQSNAKSRAATRIHTFTSSANRKAGIARACEPRNMRASRSRTASVTSQANRRARDIRTASVGGIEIAAVRKVPCSGEVKNAALQIRIRRRNSPAICGNASKIWRNSSGVRGTLAVCAKHRRETGGRSKLAHRGPVQPRPKWNRPRRLLSVADAFLRANETRDRSAKNEMTQRQAQSSVPIVVTAFEKSRSCR